MGKDKEIHGLSKVPDDVILKVQQNEIAQLKQKNHEIVQKAKEREEHWKAYTEELLKTIRILQKDEDDEEKKAIRREAKALKKKDEDYQTLLDENRRLKEKCDSLKVRIRELAEDEGDKVIENGNISRNELRYKFNKVKNRRAVMDSMGFPYNEDMPIAFNAVNFLEWVRSNRLWSVLYTAVEQLK